MPSQAAGQSGWVDAEVSRMASAWARGERPTADEVLARHPGVAGEAAVRLIFEEVCLRRESGQEVATSEVVRRYPRWRDDLEPLLGCDRLMRPPASGAVAFPDVGEHLGDFRLLAELGRGAAGRTFLAAQPTLADRPVVLKVTARDHDEHLSLARLQHTHVVPLYSVQVFPDRGLRALCMPFLGGANLAQVLDAMAGTPADRRSGRDLLRALDRLGGAAGAAGAGAATSPTTAADAAGPFRQFLERASYVQAVCWVGACLADALHYAHGHGLVHMDVKPSNVLVAADGQPMLLDFHLAASPLRAGSGPADRLGGTPGWTSPEQDEAIRALAAGRGVDRDVDGRSDVYSLGLLLDEALGGAGGPRHEARNPRVSTGLSDVVRKCLGHDPDGRYRSASALADDLRRHINDLPLAGVPNRSLAERWGKWRRRRPDALTRGSARLTAAAAAVALAFAGVVSYRQHLGEADAARAEARALLAGGHYDEAARAAGRGLALARLPFAPGDRLASIAALGRAAARGQEAVRLHELADFVRFRYGTAPAPTDEVREAAPKLRGLWDRRADLVPTGVGGGGDGDGLDPETTRRLEEDLLELAVVWADFRVRLATPGGLDEARRDALRVLDEAGAAFGPRPGLVRERLALARSLGRPEAPGAEAPAPRSAWEHYDLGRSYLRSGQTEAAAGEFRRTLEVRPNDFWSNLYEGVCDYRLGRFDDALAAFRACVVLRPDKAECRVNRALAFERLGRLDEALRDADRAAALDPGLAEAHLNRGVLLLRLGRPLDAVPALRQAVRTATGRETAARARFDLARAHLAAGDRDSAATEARRAASLGSDDARDLLLNLQAGP